MLALSPCIVVASEDPTTIKMVEDGQGGFVLDELIVRRQVEVDNVRLEADGSFSLLTTSPTDIYKALNSGNGAAVNFELSFAKHSIVMTADGLQSLESIARAIKLIGSSASFKLIVHRFGNQDPKGRKGLTKSRAKNIRNKLKYAYGLKNELKIDFQARPSLSKNASLDSNNTQFLGITVVNMG